MRALKADLHVHTTYSDGLDPVEVVLEAALEKGLDVIAITDHNTFKGSLAASKVIKEKGLDLVLVYGNEVRASYLGKLMDVLVLCPEYPGEGWPRDALTLYDWAEKRGCLYVPAHPFDSRRYGCGELLYDLEVHAIEVWNARAPRSLNEEALRAAELLGKPGIANSDAHEAEQVALAHSVLEAEPTPEGVLEAILKGRVRVVKGSVSTMGYLKYVKRKLLNKRRRY
ncbi:PHP domain-containing protein [Ignicoccus hospitalis]|uniref:PHP C-terminal domain protein n=1 Tax=Ignicoccus hospitalis (strain KIN4/I / DSM 18386 / JCM 14125) TaxID=453591 RepID=A8ABB9_IGNH4|nr:PHP domain-containing protein [Ignicoccus hospitalis]ABU82221.1 PHP C-terminal domain protein [Ignicoccus hospitalis KIN4/I]HIH90158.1 PHP domain-containing protein [Desulfurococcaceae archaeon]